MQSKFSPARIAASIKYRISKPGLVNLRSRVFKRWFSLSHPLPTLPTSYILDKAPVKESLLILEDICMPPYYGTSAHDDLSPLLAITSLQQPKTIVELGTAYGNTVSNLCRICPTSTIYTVNAPVEEQTGELVTYELKESEIGRVYKKYGDRSRVVQIYENTLNLNMDDYLPENTLIDLAIIDACHDTEYVINDFYKIAPYMAPHGIVLLHDTHPSMNDHLEGSYRACVMLRRDGYDIHHLENTWWGIWSPGSFAHIFTK